MNEQQRSPGLTDTEPPSRNANSGPPERKLKRPLWRICSHSRDELRRDGTRDSGRRSDSAPPADATHTLSAEALRSWDLSPRGASRDTYQTPEGNPPQTVPLFSGEATLMLTFMSVGGFKSQMFHVPAFWGNVDKFCQLEMLNIAKLTLWLGN